MFWFFFFLSFRILLLLLPNRTRTFCRMHGTLELGAGMEVNRLSQCVYVDPHVAGF